MGKHLSTERALYFDCELTCWEGAPPAGESPEIIEIGLVEADVLKLEITRKVRYYVRPLRSRVSEFCTSLTGITQRILDKQGRRLGERLHSLQKFGPGSKLCFTWGDDEDFLRWSCMPGTSPFRKMSDLGLRHQMETGLAKAASLEAALAGAGLQFQGTPHRALVDAENTAIFHLDMIRKVRRQEGFAHPDRDCPMEVLYPIGVTGCVCRGAEGKD